MTDSKEVYPAPPNVPPAKWKSPLILIMLGLIWAGSIWFGLSVLAREEFTPVAGAPAQRHFPAGSAIRLAVDRPTLLLFAHPHCPCTQATLRELDELLASVHGRVAVIVVFTIPRGVPTGWEQGDLWQTASRMPGVAVLRDPSGTEATRFHVNGSGHVLLYNSSGALLFSGGITPSRGHEGDNAGRSAVADFVLTGHAALDHTPVFGCSLL